MHSSYKLSYSIEDYPLKHIYKLPYPAIHFFLFVYFFTLILKDVIHYIAILSKFLHFLWKPFFPGQGTWILDMSHDPNWVIWLAEVRKVHQHHDRISNYIYYEVWDEITNPFSDFKIDTVKFTVDVIAFFTGVNWVKGKQR